MTPKYDGEDRRATKEHYVPWRYFVGTMSALLLIAGGYITLNETRLAAIQLDSEAGHARLEISLERRQVQDRLYYTEGVNRFTEVAKGNKELLRGLRQDVGSVALKQGKLETKLEFILEKIE